MTPPESDDRAARLQRAIQLKRARARSRSTDLPPRPASEAAHLGDMQRSLWLAHQMDPGSPAYNLTSAFRVRGPLDVRRLEQALDRVVARHRLLRSTFRAEGDDILQVVRPHTSISFEVREVADGAGLATAVQEARAPFDLETGPLLRARLVEEGSGREALLVLVLHHLLADERSLGLLWREVAEAYAGRLPASAPPLQYDDLVYGQRRRPPGDGEEQLDFWRRRLDPLPDELRLPFERPIPGDGLARGRLRRRPLRAASPEGLRRLALDTGVTPFGVYAFAFGLLLRRYTQGRNVAFATPVSTRSDRATAEMIGYFLNPVVVSTRIDEDDGVGPALGDFGRELKDALAHASLPFPRLAEALSPPRSRDRHPLFQAMFVYQETAAPPELGDARLEPLTLDLGASKFDLTLFVTEGEGSIEAAVEYRADRYDEVWMRQLLGHYETLLEHLPADHERPTAGVPMLGPQERGRLRSWAEGPEREASAGDLLPRQILQRARQSPASPAVAGGGVRLSYAGLEGQARAVARELSAVGVGPGDRVGVFVERSPLMVAALLGIHWAGAAYVPLDPGYPEARNRALLEDAEVTAVVTTSAQKGRLPGGRWPTIEADGLDEGGSPSPDAVDLDPDSPAYVLYTSGSTGRPKGVVVTHENLRASTEARRQVYDAPSGRFLLLPSIAFDSSVAGIFWTLATGGCLVVPTDAEVGDPRQLARLMAEEQVSGLLAVPSLYGQLLRLGGDRLQDLDLAIVAGESCPARLVEDHFRVLPGTRLFNEYGPTEATVWATAHEVQETDAAGPVPIGRPIPGVRVDVLDPRGRPVPAGIPGQAWIAGPTVARGYWRRPDRTAERFGEEAPGAGGAGNRYRTGDRMVWTADGRLLFLGREDEQIKLRGFRIEPGEVEAALLEHPDVEQATVVAREVASAPGDGSPSGNAQLVAFVQASRPGSVTRWREGLAERLPDFMIPSRLVVLPALPRLPNGKIDRRALRERALEEGGRVVPEGEVPSTREQGLISLWEGLLGRFGIGLDDNFFELGGHSLLVVEMVSAIERDFEVPLAVTDVFESPTVRELARRLEQRGGAQAPPYQHLFPIQPRGRRRPFIVAIPHFFTEMLAERFRDERPVYGLRGVSLRPEGNRGRWRTLTALGEELVEEIVRRFPEESCIMAGYSFGASMAIEAVRIMEERRIPVHRLYLIAPMAQDFYRRGPFQVQLDGLRQPVAELSTAEALRLFALGNHPLTRRPYRRAWRWLAIEPWRRFLCLLGRLRRRVGQPLTPRILHADLRVERFRLHAGYRPGVVHTPTVVFNAREPATDAAATWRPYFQGPFTVHHTPDPHDHASVEAAREVILGHLEDLGD